MHISRRTFTAALAGGLALPFVAGRSAFAADKVVRIGYQKYGTLVLLKGKGLLEQKLEKIGYAVEWTEFPGGPQLLEALNAGAVDFGSTGETPPMTHVEFYVRSASTMAGLAAEAWIGPFTGNPANLQAPPGPVPDGRFLEVEVRLSTDDRGAAPRVFSVDVSNTCITPG